ncbi:hypothetical protein [Pedobacter sp. NJ-S-72]
MTFCCFQRLIAGLRINFNSSIGTAMNTVSQQEAFLSIIEKNKGIIYKIANSFNKDEEEEEKKDLCRKLPCNYGEPIQVTINKANFQPGCIV